MFPLASLNPTAYIALGSIILNVGLLGYSFVAKTQLRACEGQFRAFVAETESQAAIQEAVNLKEVAKRDEITSELKEKNGKLQSDLDRTHSDYKRLLKSQAGSRTMPTLPETAQGIAKPEHETRLARALEQLEEGVISELARSRDEAITQANMCAAWISSQLNVK